VRRKVYIMPSGVLLKILLRGVKVGECKSAKVKAKVLEVARRLGDLPKDSEYAVVIFEDGYTTPVMTQHLVERTIVPLHSPKHGFTIAIIHTHPLPRTTPSLADLRALFAMAVHNTPVYLATVYRSKDEITITLYIATEKVSLPEMGAILQRAQIYESLHIHHGFKVSEKQVREQHRNLQRYGIKVERYRIKIR